MNFGIKTLIYFLIITFSITIYLKIFKTFEANYDSDLLKKLKQKNYRFIAHAGGGIDDLKYTNSLEAVNKSIKDNFKLIELDIRETLDNVFVGVHEWKEFKKITNIKKKDENELNNEALLLNEFKKKKIYKKYTPLDIISINDIFRKNNELILLTDKTNNFSKLNSDLNFDKKRIMVEVFGKKNYFKSISEGIINPIYSFNHKDYDFVIKHKIKIISAHSQDIINNSQIYKKLVENNVMVFMYSSNESDFINNNLDILFTHVYTDFWNINSAKCISNECTTY